MALEVTLPDGTTTVPVAFSGSAIPLVATVPATAASGATTAVAAASRHQFITALAAATALTKPTGATRATIQAEAQNVRWRVDGTAPAAATGVLLVAGDTLELFGPDIDAVRFIEAVAGAKLNVTYS